VLGAEGIICPRLLTRRGELRCQYLGGDRRGRGTAQRREKNPLTLPWGLGRGYVAL